jgi:uncharacterized membrane protein
MSKGRVEAFSDAVLAIIITIMVLELRVPHGAELGDLLGLLPVFVSYVLSFLMLGIYWNNHHHLLHAARIVTGGVLWANLHLLFWLSLVPFVTAWMGENAFAAAPVALYGFDLLMAGVAYFILSQALIRVHGRDSTIAHAIGPDRKGMVSALAYLLALPIAFFSRWVSLAIYVAIALLWLIPDRRIEREIAH